MSDAADRKRELRAPARAARRIAARSGASAAEAASENFLRHLPPRPGQIVAGYWPARNEIDPRPLLLKLAAAGMAIALPAVEGPGLPLIFRIWPVADGRLMPPPMGAHDIPAPGPECASAAPHVVLVPLLAFDRRGWRLGSGMGYYDRSLAALRRGPRSILAVGFAFAAQELAQVPHDDMDQRLDWVVTEDDTIRVGLGAPE
jgi:5-formyltetrahydrofolate cyclo-ligase